MKKLIYWIFLFSFYTKVISTKTLSVDTHPDYIKVTWNQLATLPDHWILTSRALRTEYHSSLVVPGNETRANISTASYPGVLFQVNLYAVFTNGSEIYQDMAITRSDLLCTKMPFNQYSSFKIQSVFILKKRTLLLHCSKYTNTTIGSTNAFESLRNSGNLKPGALCSWTFSGSDVTWYRISMDIFDIGNLSCDNYLLIEDTKYCGNETFNGSLLVQQHSFSIRLMYFNSTGDGIKFGVTAIHSLLQPTNVTAVYSASTIHIEWQTPAYHPDDISYVLRISHYPFTAYMDIQVGSNFTTYDYLVSSHFGQNYSMQMSSVSNELTSAFTDALFVKTSCDREMFIKATEEINIHTEQYPHNYLPEVTCTYHVQTEDDFFLRMFTHDVDIGDKTMCSTTFLKVEDLGTFCADAKPPTDVVITKSLVQITFKSNEEVNGKGVNITIKSVAKPPPAPQDIHTSADDGSIRIHWSPPSAQQNYVVGYTAQYFIAPNTPGASVVVDKNTFNYTIMTNAHPGRIYVIRIAAFSDGGRGNYSRPFYLRARCGEAISLSRHETGVIMSPSASGMYEADVLCRWTIKTVSPLWIKLRFNKMMLEESDNCSHDYVEVFGRDKLCGVHNRTVLVMKVTDVEINFRSDQHNESEGFVIGIEAVGPAPGPPRNITTFQSDYAVVVKWQPPELHRRYVSGYVVHYRINGETNNHRDRTDPNTLYHVIDVTSCPGTVLEIWLLSDGDVETSTPTNVSSIRTACGHSLQISEPIYITSPNFAHNILGSLLCQWNLTTVKGFSLKIIFIRLNLNNKALECNNFIRINSTRIYCNDDYENRDVTFDTSTVSVEFHSGTDGQGAHFLLLVEPVQNYTAKSVSAELPSSCSDIAYSSTPLLMASYFGTLLVTSFVTSSYANHSFTETQTLGPSDSNDGLNPSSSPHNSLRASIHLKSSYLSSSSAIALHSKSNGSSLINSEEPKTTFNENKTDQLAPERHSVSAIIISPTKTFIVTRISVDEVESNSEMQSHIWSSLDTSQISSHYSNTWVLPEENSNLAAGSFMEFIFASSREIEESAFDRVSLHSIYTGKESSPTLRTTLFMHTSAVGRGSSSSSGGISATPTFSLGRVSASSPAYISPTPTFYVGQRNSSSSVDISPTPMFSVTKTSLLLTSRNTDKHDHEHLTSGNQCLDIFFPVICIGFIMCYLN